MLKYFRPGSAGFEVGFAAFGFPDAYKAGPGNMLLVLRLSCPE